MATSKGAQVKVSDLLVSEDDVVVSPRGRKAVTNPILTEAFAALTEGQALNLEPVLGTSMDKTERQKMGTVIRNNWKAVRSDQPRIDFHPVTGAPQVRIKASKA